MHGILVLNRDGNRRHTRRRRRRRKKISPFKTITLWILFLFFTLSATIFFLLLVYLDLVTNKQNSRELAICCGAFGVWLSLPDELATDQTYQTRQRTHVTHHESITRDDTCGLQQCNCSAERVQSRQLPVFHQVEIKHENESNPPPPSYSDCINTVSDDLLQEEPPPTYSSLLLTTSDQMVSGV